MKLLVTGGAGYIGSVVTRSLVADGHAVSVLDNLTTGHKDAVPADVEFVEADIADAGLVLAREQFDGVLHFAAKSLVGESVEKPSVYWRNNVCATRGLLDAVTANHVPRFVFSSTAAVYGEPESVPIVETSPTAPTNPYGASKLAVDFMLRDESVAYGLAAVSLRYFNVAGASRGAGERHATETHLIPITLDVAAGKRPALDIYGTDWPTPDHTCIRDYLHVEDLAEAHVRALHAAKSGRHLVCNLGSSNGYSVRQVVDAVARVTGRHIAVRETGRRPGDPAVLVASNAAAREELGWTPTRGLEQMVADAWEFHQSRVGEGISGP